MFTLNAYKPHSAAIDCSQPAMIQMENAMLIQRGWPMKHVGLGMGGVLLGRS